MHKAITIAAVCIAALLAYFALSTDTQRDDTRSASYEGGPVNGQQRSDLVAPPDVKLTASPAAPSPSRIESASAGPTEPDARPVTKGPIAVPTSDRRIIENIQERQRLLREHVDVLAGTAPPADGWTHGRHASAATLLSAQIIYDATGKARYPSAPRGTEGAPRLSTKEAAWLYRPDEAYRMSSAGAFYEIRKGDFPTYDVMRELEDSGDLDSIPADQLPTTAILALAREALRYECIGD